MTALRQILRSTFFATDTRRFVVVNDILAGTTIVSVAAIVLETVPSLAAYERWFLTIEYAAVAIFTLEYIARLLAHERPLRYVFSFFGLVDLLAIVPTYLSLTNLTFLKTARVLRILRFMRMIRLAKLTKTKRPVVDMEEDSALYRVTILLYFTTLFFAVLICGALLYVVEGGVGTYSSIPAAMAKAMEFILGGVSSDNPLPVTPLGEAIMLLTRFVGLVLFGLLLTVVGKTVQRLIFGTHTVQ